MISPAIGIHREHWATGPLKRVIQREVADELALALLENQFPEGATVRLDVEAEAIVLQ